ncbi:MAG TPA: four helix bundle protein [Syntrophobacteraceae bacterium]|nr:four helix bundle protein [Syntrophobacteraceae bacterium]
MKKKQLGIRNEIEGCRTVVKENVIQQKSYALALRIVKLYRWLCEEKKEFTLSKQILRCATSVGANVEEGIGAQSEKDFHLKMTIAYKESREIHYWLRLLHDSDYIDDDTFSSLLADCDELIRILSSITKTMKTKLKI